MAISFVNGTTSTGTGGATIVINKPTGVVANDVMIASVYGSFAASLTGWTQIGPTADDGAGNVLTILRRVVDGTEGSSFTFSTSGNIAFIGSIAAYRGVNTTTPEDATPTVNHGSGATLTYPTITTATANAWWLAVGTTDGSATTLSLPTSFTADVPSFGAAGDVQRVSHEVRASTGATGTTTSTQNDTGGWLTASVALKPAGSGGTTFTQNVNVTTATTASVVKQVGKSVAVSTATSPGVLKQVGKGITVTTVTSPSLRKLVGKVVSVTTATSPSVATSKFKVIAIAVTTATIATVSKLVGKVVAVNTATQPSLRKQVGKAVTVSTATQPHITKLIGKLVSVSTATSATAQTSKVKLVVIAVATATVATVTRLVGKTVQVSTATQPSLHKQVGKVVSASTATQPSITKAIGKTVTVSTATQPRVTKLIGKNLAVTTATTAAVTTLKLVIAVLRIKGPTDALTTLATRLVTALTQNARVDAKTAATLAKNEAQTANPGGTNAATIKNAASEDAQEA